MNKAVMIAVLFCLTSLTGCIGDDSTNLEELKEKPGYAGTVFNVSIPLFKTYSKM